MERARPIRGRPPACKCWNSARRSDAPNQEPSLAIADWTIILLACIFSAAFVLAEVSRRRQFLCNSDHGGWFSALYHPGGHYIPWPPYPGGPVFHVIVVALALLVLFL